MNYKKTWFGWLNFAVGTIFMSVFIFTLLVSLFEFNGLTMSLFNYPWAKASFLVAGAIIVVTTGILCILHFVKKKLVIKENFFNGIACNIIYWLLYTGILAFGIYLRYREFLSFSESSIVNQSYYLRVMSFFDGNTSFSGGLITTSFCYIYSFLLKVFGLTASPLIITNILFQVFGAVLAASSLKNAFGKTVSLCGFSLVMLFKGSLCLNTVISPDCYFFFITMLVVWLMSCLIKDREDGLLKSNINVILFVLLGLIFGFLIYLNPLFLIIPIYFVCRLLLLSDNVKKMDIAINRKTLPVLSVIASTLIGTLVSFVVAAIIKNTSIVKEFDFYYNAQIGYSGFLRIFYPNEIIIVCLIILFFSFAGYINYIFVKKDYISALTVLLITLYAAYAVNLIAFDLSVYILIVMGALMGTGIKSIFFDGYGSQKVLSDTVSDDDQAGTETSNQESGSESEISKESNISPETEEEAESETIVNESSSETAEADSTELSEVKACEQSESFSTSQPEVTSESTSISESEAVSEDISDTETENCQVSESEEKSSEDSVTDFNQNSESTDSESISTEESESIISTDSSSEEIKEQAFKPIDNVLPLPKKHVKKEMTFSFDPGEKYMKYDVEIADNDDFDF